ncbi:MAG: glycosyltransferase family 2 protein [Bacteroidota bacterium]
MKCAVLIPAYNASLTLGELLSRTAPVIASENIIVVDDGSTDATAQIAERYHVQLLRHSANRGKGAALQTGFDRCIDGTYDAVITMDADLQHRPEDIPRFIERHRLLHRDIIIGSRLHKLKGMPFHRILSNTITTFLVRTRTGMNVADSQSGFRFISMDVIKSVRLDSAGYEAETEFLIKAALKGFTVDSIPIDTIYAGEKSHMKHIETTVQFIRTLFRHY